ncbi:Ricin B-related lectin domain protein [Pseudohyphozyma bogoriensis]|nr:Ricin B-related lectin domain protein [Pseudohyphozyma bogoriensis]
MSESDSAVEELADEPSPSPPPPSLPTERRTSQQWPSSADSLTFPDGVNPPPSYASIATPLVSSLSSFPPVDSPFEHAHHETGLPSGFFLLRSQAPRQRTFDVIGRGGKGTEVFYLDWNGHLMSASAEGCAIDCVDNNLFLSLPGPIFAIPSRTSHPLPHFVRDPQTSVLRVHFGCDPTFPGPHGTHDWHEDEYIVEQVPVKKKKQDNSGWQVGTGLISGLERFAGLLKIPLSPATSTSGQTSTFSNILSPSLSSTAATSPRPPWESHNTPNSSRVFDVSQLRRASGSSDAPLPPLPPLPASPELQPEEESDSDDEPEAYRPLRVVRLPPHWRDKFPNAALSPPPPPDSGIKEPKSLRLWRRRQWDVVPVIVRPVETRQPIIPVPSSLELPLPDLPTAGRMGPPSPLNLNGDGGVGLGVGPVNTQSPLLDRKLPRVPSGVEVDGDGDGEEEEEEDDQEKIANSKNGPATGSTIGGFGNRFSVSWNDAKMLPADINGLAVSDGSTPSASPRLDTPEEESEEDENREEIPSVPASPSPTEKPPMPSPLTLLEKELELEMKKLADLPRLPHEEDKKGDVKEVEERDEPEQPDTEPATPSEETETEESEYEEADSLEEVDISPDKGKGKEVEHEDEERSHGAEEWLADTIDDVARKTIERRESLKESLGIAV